MLIPNVVLIKIVKKLLLKTEILCLFFLLSLFQCAQAQVDGTIIYSARKDGNQEIYSLDLKNNQQIRLTQNQFDDGYPRWRNDGKKIVFATNRNKKWQIYLMNKDGSSQAALPLEIEFTDAGYAEWSPNGEYLVFAASEKLNAKADIYIVRGDGKGLKKLTNHQSEDVHPTWSPDGKQIAFASDRDGNREIYLINLDGSGLSRITNNRWYDDYPSWSPNGEQLVFASEKDSQSPENLDLFTMKIDGTSWVKITFERTDERHPTWSPDGKMLAFVSNRDGNRDIFISDSNGSNLRKIISNLGDDEHPHWLKASLIVPTSVSELPTLFLLDVSGSMEENGKITQAKNAGLDAVREMQENRRRKQDNSTVSIWTFGGDCTPRDVKQLLPFTSNLTQAENIFLRGITPPNGATPLYTAINISVERMTEYLAARPQLGEGKIVVLTDGENTCGDQIRPRGVYSQSQNIINQKIKFLCIGFDVAPGSKAERDLQYLASSSGGKYYPARDSAQLKRAFQKAIRVYVPKPSNNESGTRAIVNRDFGNALQIWTIYIKNNPSDPVGYYNLALVCEAMERPKCAAENYRQYIKLQSTATDSPEVVGKISNLEQDYRSQFTYYVDLLRSDLEYLKEYYKRLTSLKNAELAAEFAGFVSEKGDFYRNLTTILEIRSPRIERNSTDLADSLDFLKRRVNSPSFDRDALSLLTIPIGHLEELIERLDEYKAKNF